MATRATTVPEGLLLETLMPEWTFRDCCCRDLSADSNALGIDELCFRVFGTAPRWVDWLMDVRNIVVGWFGLKNVGRLRTPRSTDPERKNRPLAVGDRVGAFRVFGRRDDEVVMGETDRHLDVLISLRHDRAAGVLYISTSVREHNRLGWAYMLVVKPAHKIIAPAVLRAAAL